jgi:hypothetical protein
VLDVVVEVVALGDTVAAWAPSVVASTPPATKPAAA